MAKTAERLLIADCKSYCGSGNCDVKFPKIGSLNFGGKCTAILSVNSDLPDSDALWNEEIIKIRSRCSDYKTKPTPDA